MKKNYNSIINKDEKINTIQLRKENANEMQASEKKTTLNGKTNKSV